MSKFAKKQSLSVWMQIIKKEKGWLGQQKTGFSYSRVNELNGQEDRKKNL